MKQDKQRIQEALAAKESEMQSLLTELEATRIRNPGDREKSGGAPAAAVVSAKPPQMPWALTRLPLRKRLIDTELTAVGWDVGVNGVNTGEVTQEEEIQHQPTKTGIGYADYVLWDDNGQPLAVVEAKKTAVSAELGQQQAKLYADGLETVHGRRPVIFYTNGFDIFIWDDGCGYPPRKIYGFYSKDSLQYLIYKRKTASPWIRSRRNPKSSIGSIRSKPLSGSPKSLRKPPQGAAGPGHRNRQDPRGHCPDRSAEPRKLG